MTLQELRDKRAAAWAKAQEFNQRNADGEEMSAEDEASWARALDEVDELGDQIRNRERTETLDKRFEEIDGETREGGAGDDGQRHEGDPDDSYREAFDAYIRFGLGELNPEQRQQLADAAVDVRAQGIATGGAGGYTVPQGFWAKVTETMLHFGGVMGNVEVLNTDAGNDIPWPTNDDTANKGSILAENTQISEQDLVFGQKTLNAYTYTSDLIRASLQFLQDSGIDAESFVARKIGERLGRIHNEHWTTGTGSSQPQGFVTGATVGKTTAGATAIAYDEMVDLVHSVDVAYRGGAIFEMHDLVLAYVRKLKDSQNRPLWQPAISAEVPDTLLGYRVVVNNDMASAVATTNKTMAFGDLRSAYVARIVRGGQLMRLSERYADYLQVGFFGFDRADGLTQDASAVKVLQQA